MAHRDVSFREAVDEPEDRCEEIPIREEAFLGQPGSPERVRADAVAGDAREQLLELTRLGEPLERHDDRDREGEVGRLGARLGHEPVHAVLSATKGNECRRVEPNRSKLARLILGEEIELRWHIQP
ncbi:MAG: hypothetical protein ACLP50_04065 [Solirubrobacteraceae bacterium]